MTATATKKTQGGKGGERLDKRKQQEAERLVSPQTSEHNWWWVAMI
jgi:hypothetical protein